MDPVWAVVATYGPLLLAGAVSERWLRGRGTAGVERAALSIAFGVVASAVLVFVFGWLRLLHPGVFVVIGAASTSTAAVLFRRTRSPVPVGAGIRRCRPRELVAAGTGTLAALVGLAAAMRWEMTGDERDYKWAAPLAWAEQGRFSELPFRLSNGFNLAEYLSTPAALFSNLVVARSVNILVVFGLGLVSWALVRRTGSSLGWLAGLAVVTSPIAAGAYRAVNSDALPALCLGAALLAGLELSGRAATVTTNVLLAAAVLAKVIVIPVAGVVAAVVAFERLGDGSERRPVRWIVDTLRLGVGTITAVGAGVLHTLALTGHLFATKVKNIFPSDDPMVLTGAAAGRIPDLVDLLRVPVDPFLLAVIGQQEPYGGRIGLLLLVGLPVVTALFLTRRAGAAAMLVATAWASYLLMAPVFPKTRFLWFSWMCAGAAIAVVADRLERSGTRFARLAVPLCTTVVVVSFVADPVRVLVRGL